MRLSRQGPHKWSKKDSCGHDDVDLLLNGSLGTWRPFCIAYCVCRHVETYDCSLHLFYPQTVVYRSANDNQANAIANELPEFTVPNKLAPTL